MERNFISQWQATGFYVNLESHIYGVCINISDIDRKDEIIQQILEENEQSIEAWKRNWKEGVA